MNSEKFTSRDCFVLLHLFLDTWCHTHTRMFQPVLATILEVSKCLGLNFGEIGCLVEIILLFRSQKTQHCLTHIATNLGQSFSKEGVCGYFLHVKRKERKDISVWLTLPLVVPCFWKKEV